MAYVLHWLRCRTRYALGVLALRLGKLSLAAHWLQGALTDCPDDLSALHYLAGVLTELGRFEDSVAKYQELVERTPDSSAGRLGLANGLQRLGRHEEAIDAFQAALDRDFLDPLILYNLATSLIACGRLQDGLVVYRRLVRLQPEAADAIGNLGALLGILEHWEEALECGQRAFALEPNLTNAHNMAVSFFELGRFVEAEEAFRRALKFEPRSSDLRVRLAMALAEQEKHPEAIEVLGGILTEFADDSAALSYLVAVLAMAGRSEEAVGVATKFAGTCPTLSLAHETLGWAYMKQGSPERALRSYDDAIALAPDNPDLHAGRGAALSRAGRHHEAIEAFNVAVAAAPDCLRRNQELAQHFDISRKALGGP